MPVVSRMGANARLMSYVTFRGDSRNISELGHRRFGVRFNNCCSLLSSGICYNIPFSSIRSRRFSTVNRHGIFSEINVLWP
jgi:hypothetical protein